ncbi:MAG: PadR family transcriptional regulator [Pseudomonadota bacterium]
MALSHAIATALLDGPLSGYDLARRFETSLGFFWAASHQQIYQELKKLTQAGQLEARRVEQSGRPDKVEYKLTEPGHRALAAWALTESRRRPAKDDLFVKLYQLNEQNRAHLVREIKARLAQHQAKAELYEKIRAHHYADPEALSQRRQGVYLALAAGIRYEAMFMDWCREALELLDHSPLQPD